MNVSRELVFELVFVCAIRSTCLSTTSLLLLLLLSLVLSAKADRFKSRLMMHKLCLANSC